MLCILQLSADLLNVFVDGVQHHLHRRPDHMYWLICARLSIHSIHCVVFLTFSCDGDADEDVDVFLNLTPLKVAVMQVRGEFGVVGQVMMPAGKSQF
jgi:hypothetical protein